jgi:uncharacterized OB-fold protein
MTYPDTSELPHLSRCRGCDQVSFPPKRFCPHCGSRDLIATPLPTKGEVYSYTVVPGPDGSPRRLALVNVGGVRVLAPVPGGTPEVAVGIPVGLRASSEPPGYEVADVARSDATVTEGAT